MNKLVLRMTPNIFLWKDRATRRAREQCMKYVKRVDLRLKIINVISDIIF